MPVPHTFVPGAVIEAAQANANFAWLQAAIGSSSSGTILAPTGSMVRLGPRNNSVLSTRRDTVADGNYPFIELNWNAEPYWDTNVWKLRRYLTDENASTLTIGKSGLNFSTTDKKTGDLDTQLRKLFGVTTVNGVDYVYMHPMAHISKKDGTPSSLQDMRLTYVPLNSPQALYTNATKTANTVSYRATDYDVHSNAVAVEVVAAMKTNANAATWKITQTGSNNNMGTGLVLQSEANGRAAASGIVHLGTGSNAGKFTENRSNTLYEASLYIKGYWL